MIHIDEISVDDVVVMDKSKYNSNNHWVDGIMPSDYLEVLHQSHAHIWIHKFKVFHELKICDSEIPWLVKASEIGMQTGRFPRQYNEELDALIASHPTDLFANGKGYFVRCDNVSLKYGRHGTGPYYDLRSIIESTVTCIHGHKPLHVGSTSLSFYLLDWVTIAADREFRVFIHDNRITCISQQYTTKPNEILKACAAKDQREALILHWISIISDFWKHEIRPRIDHISSYTIDLAILSEEKPYFIEINCFGKEYAAGSSLFHWLLDEDKLYNRSDDLYFRYAT